jgi:hypothetical protein
MSSELRLSVLVRSDRHRASILGGLSERATAAMAENRLKGLVSVHREGAWLRIYASSYGR